NPVRSRNGPLLLDPARAEQEPLRQINRLGHLPGGDGPLHRGHPRARDRLHHRLAQLEVIMAKAQEVEFGVHSEVGQLRKVLVCAPGRAHQRLTPSNCDQLLFDDVLWVENAKRDHFDFVQKMRDRGTDVVEMHDLLTKTVEIPEAKKWILDNQVVPNQVGLGLVDEIKSYLAGRPARELAETLIGGLSTEEFPATPGGDMRKLVKDASGVTEYLLPPLPNTLYTRDTTCWIYGGCTLNPLYWPARHEEPILTTSIYKFHPDFAGKVNVWWGDPTQDH